ncbi:MAG: hypothetical protein JJE25_06865 [Bacteroidia bacterium]|nr:hypothetical protein [Bacteroidia bacterium]
MTRKKFVLIVFLLTYSVFYFLSASAQRNTDSKFYYGGNLGLMFGTYTIIDISPFVAYKVTESFHVGSGLTYTYYKFKEDGTFNGGHATSGQSFSTSIYGIRFFTRFFFTDNLFLHAEDELLSLELPDLTEYYLNHRFIIKRQWLNSVLLGGGYKYGFNVDGPSLSISVLFRVNHEFEDFYPYQNPIIRIGLGFGL